MKAITIIAVVALLMMAVSGQEFKGVDEKQACLSLCNQ